MGAAPGEDVAGSGGGPGVELWERLAGRLAAALAWKRLKLLLAWLSQELTFSEGVEERTNWLSDDIVEMAGDLPSDQDWTFERCSRAMIACMAQLHDPSPGAVHYPAPGSDGRGALRPKDKEDMLYWIQYEAAAYPLDWAVSVLFEMVGLSEEAEAADLYPLENIVMDVMDKVRGVDARDRGWCAGACGGV